MKLISYYLWTLYLLFSIYYFNDSGAPQISDYINVLFIATTLFCFMMDCKIVNKKIDYFLYFYLFLFVYYVFVVSALWSYFLDVTFVDLSPMYYFYNSLVFVCCVLWSLENENFVKLTIKAYYINLVLIVVYYFFNAGEYKYGRYVAFFNDPNQLGYYLLVSFMICVLYIFKKEMYYYRLIGYLILVIYVLLLTSSRSTIIGFITVALVYASGKMEFKKIFNVIGILIIVFILLSFLEWYDNEQSNLFYIRLMTTGMDHDDNFAGRGYDRLLNNWEFLLFGASEYLPNVNKYIISAYKGEIHSTVATILFSYGIVGFVIFLLFLNRLVCRVSMYEMFYLLPIFVYGLTTNGFRNTNFWIFLSFYYTIMSKKK